MKKNTWKQDTLARQFRDSCDIMRLWMQQQPERLLEMKDGDLAVMADVAMQVYDSIHLIIDERRAREQAARIGGTVDVRG